MVTTFQFVHRGFLEMREVDFQTPPAEADSRDPSLLAKLLSSPAGSCCGFLPVEQTPLTRWLHYFNNCATKPSLRHFRIWMNMIIKRNCFWQEQHSLSPAFVQNNRNSCTVLPFPSAQTSQYPDVPSVYVEGSEKQQWLCALRGGSDGF